MAVEYVTELFDGRPGDQDQKADRKYTRRWEVRTTDPYDDSSIVYQGAGLPVIGDPYITPNFIDLGAVVVNSHADCSDADPTLWTATAQYDSASRVPGSGGDVDSDGQGGQDPTTPGTVPQDPLARAPVWKGGSTKLKIPITDTFDLDGEPVVAMNRAGQPFIPALERTRSLPKLTVSVNKPLTWLNLATLYGDEGYVDGVNETIWKGLTARVVLVEDLEWEEAFENDLGFLKVTWHLAVKWDKWDLVVANVGFFELLGDGTTDPPTDTTGPWRYRKIVDAQGREPTDPVPLDLSGRKLPPGSSPLKLTFRDAREFDFNGVVP